MTKTKSLLILIFALLFSNYYLSSFPEGLTITTYYPSPVGIYKELRAKRMAIGDNYYKPSDYSWGSEISSDADLVVEGKVGIGTTTPSEKLHVAGNTKIDGDLDVGGNIQLGKAESTTIIVGSLNVNGDTEIQGDLKVDGNTQLGNSSSDKTTVEGDLNMKGRLIVATKWASATGDHSVALGYDPQAKGDYSVALGRSTASGAYSFATGIYTKAGYAAFSAGYHTIANGAESIAAGKYTKAGGDCSFVFGSGVSTLGGISYLENNTNHSFMVGFNGNPTLFVDRSKVKIKGDLIVTNCIQGKFCNLGDLVFKNNFKIVEAEDENALYFLNQKGEKIMKLDENGNLFVKGKIIENFDFGK